MFRFLSWLTLALLLVLPCGICSADPADSTDLPIIRNEVLGYNRQFHNHRWAPLRIEIDNPGPARQAVLAIEPFRINEGQSISITKPIWLPAKSKRSFWLTVLPEASENAPSAKSDEPNTKILKVFTAKITDGGLKVWSQIDVMGKLIPEYAAIMVVADARLTSYRMPDDIAVGWGRRTVQRVTLQPHELPAHEADYDGVNVLVLGNPELADLNTMQRQAIVDWVGDGGTVLFAPGPGTANRWFADWQAQLPVYYRPADRLATEPLLSRWGAPVIFQEGLTLQRMVKREGEILAGDDNAPLLVAHKEGLGTVAAFSLDSGDLAFQRWPGAVKFNEELIDLSLRTPPSADRILEHSSATDAIVSSLAGIKVLSRGAVLVYLALLVGSMITVLSVFRRTRTPERGWTLVAGLAVIGGGVVIIAADRWKGLPQPFLTEIDIVNVGRTGERAVTHTALGLYSPHAAKFDLTMAGSSVLRPPVGNGITPEPFAMVVDDQVRIPALAVRASDIRAMYGEAELPADKFPQARARLNAAGLEVSIDNPGRQPLTDCFFKYNRFLIPLGDLPTGSSRTYKDLRSGAIGEDLHYSGQTVHSIEDELRTRIRRVFFPDPIYAIGRPRMGDLMALRFATPSGSESPAVHGWSDQPLFPMKTGAATLARRAVGFWDIAAPLTCDGPQLTIPRGLLTLQMKNLDARTVERAEGRFSGTRNSTLIGEFSLPPECPNLRLDDVKVVVAFNGSAFRCRVSMLPPGADVLNYSKLKPQPPLAGGPVYAVADPGKWYDPIRRSLTVVVDIEPVDATAAQQSSAVNYWQIRELDMELGGTVQ